MKEGTEETYTTIVGSVSTHCDTIPVSKRECHKKREKMMGSIIQHIVCK